MKKTKCDLSKWYTFPSVFGIFSLLHLLGIRFWTRNGWQEPTIKEGIYWLILTIISYTFIKYFCAKAHIVKCLSCKDVFSETNTQYENCPNCGGELMNIKKYYDKSNKNLERNSLP